MGLFDTISNVFFEEEQLPSGPAGKRTSSPGSATNPGKTIPSPTSNSNLASSNHTQYPTSNTNQSIDQKIVGKFNDSLMEALEKSNLPGFDFYEFHQLYNRFLKDGKSDREAIQTALTSAETMRIDKNILISNFGHYKKILDEQKIIFENDLKDFFDNNIQNPKHNFSKIEKDIHNKEKLIQQYTQDILNLKNDQVNLGIDVEKAENQIEKVSKAFQYAYDTVHDNIKTLNEKLKTL